MTEFETFKPFFDAMIKEMQRHDSKKGDSWKREWVSLDGADLMNEHLDDSLGRCFLRFLRNPFRVDELLDIANLCAMRWLRTCKEKAIE